MTLHFWLLLVAGIGLLIAGAELLVRGASRLAIAVGVSPLVVGLTVVAFGTSSPELAVTVRSAYIGQADVAVGNIVGSNIFNILLILGLSAVIAPLIVAQQLVRIEVPLMIAASVLTLLLGLDGRIGRADGIVLLSGIAAYTVFVIRQSRRETAAVRAEYAEAFRNVPVHSRWTVNVGFVALGLALVIVGAHLLVDAAVAIASALGVSDLVIGLTVVAAGTSLPELAASVIAALRRERDIAVGNAIGSNLFNLLCVLGLGSVVAPAGLSVSTGALTFDIPIMIAVALATLPVFFTGYLIARWEGAVFLAYYAAYVMYLVLDATGHAALAAFGAAMLWFALPLTALTLAVVAARAVTQRDTHDAR